VTKADPKRTARVKNLPEKIISWIIIHLGTKPVKGGSPPKDSKDINIRSFK